VYPYLLLVTACGPKRKCIATCNWHLQPLLGIFEVLYVFNKSRQEMFFGFMQCNVSKRDYFYENIIYDSVHCDACSFILLASIVRRVYLYLQKIIVKPIGDSKSEVALLNKAKNLRVR
jgi:hypothetical protein